MKKRQHKWFRNERYKLKLEHSVDNHKTYYSNIFFITKEVDYEYVQKRWNEHWSYWWTDERKWEYLTRKEHGKDYYIYYIGVFNMESILSYQDVSKIYGSKVALDGINLDIPQNSIIGLLGPNGSGKTTLLKLASGLLTPSTGTITSLGNKIGAVTKENIAYQPDRVFLNDWMTVLDLINMMADFFSNFNKEKALDLVKDLHLNPKDRIKTLSKGNKEKVQLIMTMSREVKLYLLDEPIGGVDPAAREYILKTILNNYKENSSIIISTHLILDVEEILTYIIFLKQGHIVRQGNANEIRQNTGMTIDQLFREEFRC